MVLVEKRKLAFGYPYICYVHQPPYKNGAHLFIPTSTGDANENINDQLGKTS